MIRIDHLALVLMGVLGSGLTRGRETFEFESQRSAPQRPAPTSQHGIPVRGIRIGGLEVWLDSSQTLSGVRAVLGASPLHRPQHHDDDWSVCYTVAVGTNSIELRLLSNELGGREHIVLGFELTELRARNSSGSACPATTRPLGRLTTDNDLRLGMPVSELLSRMGTPIRHSKDRYEFEFSQSVPARGAINAYDVSGSLRAETTRGRVTKLWVWYVRTT